ncbi:MULTISPECIES: Circumsporozoite protein [unclassified Corallococcus]|uniref:Circumsporozoite protein n=1 Tax=unclassified Corallococcus TaxID=2685029 RepID=UPI001A8ED1BB|nr:MULTISPECIES: Circumsporozoite protein [unclassified Corallococcus]MBN9682595.1 Circumsporozoite protein [Corallococcus sp. NCSPR001]WAS85859.1 Circumsporozoite protein [Corallococcus sp. NCRR]
MTLPIGYRPLPPPPPPPKPVAPPPAKPTTTTQQQPGTQPSVSTQTQGNVQTPSRNVLSGESSFEAGGSRAEVNGTGPGGVNTNAYVQGPTFSADASVDADIGLSGIDVNVQVDVSANLVEAGASATKTVDFEIAGEQYSVELDLAALGKIGAEGSIDLDLHVGTDGNLSLNAAASGFAGAQASLTGGIELKHEGDTLASASITASASAGVSGDAHADIGLDGGNLEFDVGVEATAGLGLGVEVEGSVNPGNILKAVGETAAAAGGEVLENIAEGAINAGGAVADAAGDVFNGAVDVLGDLAGGVKDGLSTVGDWVTPW